MAEGQTKSIFHNRNGFKKPTQNKSVEKSFAKPEDADWSLAGANSFEINAPMRNFHRKRRQFGPYAEEELYDEFDGMERYKALNSGMNSDLFRYFSLEDVLGGSYDHLEPHFTNLTECGGVKKFCLKEGDEVIPDESNVWLHYISFAEGNDEPIDSTRSRELLASYRLGAGDMIPGVEVGVRSMQVGEIAKFLLAPQFAYGKMGCPGLIPKDCCVLIAIEVVKASTGREKKPVFQMTSYERRDLSFEVIYKGAMELKEAGNRKFGFQKYDDAIERYEKGIEILEEALLVEVEAQQLRAELQFLLFCNIALCHLRSDEPELCIDACESALMPGMPEPKNAKVYYRYADAAFKLKNYSVADKYCGEALRVEPRNWELLMFQREIRSQLKQEEADRLQLYKKMSPIF